MLGYDKRMASLLDLLTLATPEHSCLPCIVLGTLFPCPLPNLFSISCVHRSGPPWYYSLYRIRRGAHTPFFRSCYFACTLHFVSLPPAQIPTSRVRRLRPSSHFTLYSTSACKALPQGMKRPPAHGESSIIYISWTCQSFYISKILRLLYLFR